MTGDELFHDADDFDDLIALNRIVRRHPEDTIHTYVFDQPHPYSHRTPGRIVRGFSATNATVDGIESHRYSDSIIDPFRSSVTARRMIDLYEDGQSAFGSSSTYTCRFGVVIDVDHWVRTNELIEKV